MRKLSIFNRQRFPAFLFCFFYISMSFLISGCSGGGGGGADSSSELSETASASFTIAWHAAPGIQTLENSLIATQEEAVDCELIQNIICEVYDGSNTFLTSEVFECSARQGTIDHIPPGENRVFLILGEDIDGNILYHGEVSGIPITAGETNDLGIIDCYYFVPTLLGPDDNSDVIIGQFSLNWTPVETAYEYRVQVSEDLNFDTTAIDETTPNIPYTPSGLSESTTYYWRVFALDIRANQGMESQEVWSFSVISEEECTYSISPASRSFECGGGAGSISVTSSTSGCSWTATESVDWIEITSGGTGSGDGTVTYTVSENTTEDSRTAIITVAGQTHMVTQSLPIPSLVKISGPNYVYESSGAQFTLTAYWSDGSSTDVTGSATWSQNSTYASISSGGYLTTSAVSSDESCTIRAEYGGKSDVHYVTIKNVPPTVSSVTISGPNVVNSDAQYTLTAIWSDGSSTNVTGSASWGVGPEYGTISGGYFEPYGVEGPETCIITASYGGQSATYSVTIIPQ